MSNAKVPPQKQGSRIEPMGKGKDEIEKQNHKA